MICLFVFDSTVIQCEGKYYTVERAHHEKLQQLNIEIIFQLSWTSNNNIYYYCSDFVVMTGQKHDVKRSMVSSRFQCR